VSTHCVSSSDIMLVVGADLHHAAALVRLLPLAAVRRRVQGGLLPAAGAEVGPAGTLPGRFHPQFRDTNRRDIGKISVTVHRIQDGSARLTAAGESSVSAS
jgi:hypothetical protein